MAFKNINDIPPGHVTNSLFQSRMIRSNKNVLIATIGKTGSGKSWMNMSMCEMWYNYKFKRPYPEKNICFDIDQVIRLLASDTLERGEILILEEGGVNMGNMDFQTKIAKSFNYILQSFRSLNVGLVVNLPFFTMLNKQTRMLMHLLLETQEIDQKRKMVVVKPLLLDYNQRYGSEYTHYPKILVDGTYEKMHRLTFPKPSDALIEAYERRKKAFVLGTIESAQGLKKNSLNITELQAVCYYLRRIKEMEMRQIADMLKIKHQTVSKHYHTAMNHGLNEQNITDFKAFYRKYEDLKPFSQDPAQTSINYSAYSNKKNETAVAL